LEILISTNIVIGITLMVLPNNSVVLPEVGSILIAMDPVLNQYKATIVFK